MAYTWQGGTIGEKAVDTYGPGPHDKPRHGLFFLHDEDRETLADKPAFVDCLEASHFACICPHGGNSWWTDRLWPQFDPRLTAEKFLMELVLPEFEKRWALGPGSLGLLGIGMGGQAALRLAFKYPEKFPVVAAIAAAIDCYEMYGQGTALDDLYESKEACRQDTAIMHIHPTRFPPHIFFAVDRDDRWFRGNDRLDEKLNALGIGHDVEFSRAAGGHSWKYFNAMAAKAVAFVDAGLIQESRRLL
jgi:S-formylglutathione hydrolase